LFARRAMADLPKLTLDESTLRLHAETKASPLLAQFKSHPPCNPASTPTSVSSLSSASSGTVCYICHCDDTKQPFLRNVCGCKKKAVHSKCLATWLHYSAARRDGAQAPLCEVCLQALDLPLALATYTPPRPSSARGAAAASPSLASFSLPALFAFVYGFSSPSLCSTPASTAYTCLIGNAIVLLVWIVFVVRRIRSSATPQQRKAVEDILMLLCVYVMFLCGWMLQKWSMPRVAHTALFATVHFSNAGCVGLTSALRLAYSPCRAGCQCAWSRPPVTITLDLGD